MSALVRIGVKTTATAATIEHAITALWNPHATKTITLNSLALSITAATACECALRRISARGTAGSSVTAARSHDSDYGAAPQSGAIADIAPYSVQPTLIGTLAAEALFGWAMGAAVGAGFMERFEGGVEIPPGTGLCLVTVTAVAFPVSRVNYVFED